MCPLKREQARRERDSLVMRRLPTADSNAEIGEKGGHELDGVLIYLATMQHAHQLSRRAVLVRRQQVYCRKMRSCSPINLETGMELTEGRLGLTPADMADLPH